MFIISLIFIQLLSFSLGNDEYITVLNVQSMSNKNKRFQCYTPSTFSDYQLRYGRSFKIENSEDALLVPWDFGEKHKYATTEKFGMGVYFCEIIINGKATRVQTTKIRNDAVIKPSNNITSITVNAGDNVTISFEGGDEDWNVYWRKDGALLTNETTNIKRKTLNRVNTSHAGMYEVYREGQRSNRTHSFINLIVRACPRHKWDPPECERDCEYCYNGGVCDDQTGNCVCAPGFKGATCKDECGGNSFGWNCESKCTYKQPTSDHYDACKLNQFCLPHPYGCSCIAGFQGLACDTICESGKYGADCAQFCHCNQGECNRYTGQCTDTDDSSCEHPWTGTNCQECQERYYGENCEFQCTKPCVCHRGTGDCKEGTCHANWLEPKCEIRLPSYNGNLQIVNISVSSVTIIWDEWNMERDEGEGPIEGYYLHYKLSNVEIWEKQYQESLSGTVVGLMSDTNYTFAVSAVRPGEGGEGPIGTQRLPVSTVPCARIVNTTFLSANNGQNTTVNCIVIVNCNDVRPLIRVMNFSTPIFVPSSSSIKDIQGITTYKFQVTSNVNLAYTCVVLYERRIAASSDVVPNIYVLPSYNGRPMFVNSSSSSVTIKWTAWIEEAGGDGPVIGYYLHYKTINASNWEGKQYQKSLSGTVSGLTWDTNYTFALSAVRPGEGGEGPVGKHRLFAKTLPCGEIVDTAFLSANDGQNTTVNCTVLEDCKDEINSYILVKHEPNKYEYIASSLSTTGALNNTTYTFKVPSNVGSTYSCVVYCQNRVLDSRRVLPNIHILPSYNGRLMFVNTSSHSITIKWTPWINDTKNGDGPVEGYYLYYKVDDEDSWENKTYQESLSGTVTGLMWDTMYKFAVSAVRPGEGGEGPVGTQHLYASTLACGRIVDTAFLPANNGQNTSVNCTIYDDCEVDIRPSIMVISNSTTEQIASSSSTTAGQSTTTFIFSVKTNIGSEYRCLISEGRLSNSSDIEPNIFLAPSYNSKPKLVNASSSSMTIKWNAWKKRSKNGDGPVTGYFLHYKISSKDNWENKIYQDSLSRTVADLKWDTNYIFALSAVRPGVGGEGPIGKRNLSATTLCGKPDPVEIVEHELSNTNSQNVLVTWKDINVTSETLKCHSASYNYSVYIKLKDGDGIEDLVYKGNESQFIIENIGVNASLYMIWVTVSNKDEESQATESYDITASDSTISPNTVEGITEPHNSNLGIIGGVVAAFICVCICLFVFLIFKHRNSRDEKKWQRSQGSKVRLQRENDNSEYNMADEDKTRQVNIPLSVHLPDAMNTYENVTLKPKNNFSRRIPISELIHYVAKTGVTGLRQEFDLLPIDKAHPWLTAAKECNKTKNRFKNIIPYDHARVVLNTVDGNPDSDYYNASYINGYMKPKHYIACQGPNKTSLKDFWRLVWQFNIEVIVMLTNLCEGTKIKCEKYWPEEQESFVFDGINVSVTSEEINADYVIRNMSAWREGNAHRTIKQFHFTVWPDKGVPKSASGLLCFIKKIRAAREHSEKPSLVHCSAGVGRTGTYIVIDAMLDMIKDEGSVDILNYIKDIRENRVNMVQTADQYVFIYNALTESHLNEAVQFPLSQFDIRLASLKRTNGKTMKTFMEEEFELLVAVTPFPDPKAMMSGRQEHNIKKNRFANVLPVDRSRVILNSEINNYINASFLDGYKMSSRFIATQMTLADTVEDMWRLVYDWKATTIVMLNAMDQSDPTCAQYWQDEGGSISADNLEIQFISEENRGENIIIRNISINTKRSTPMSVTQYQVTNWPVGQDSPDKLETLIELYEIVESSNVGGQHPIVVHCLNGIGRTGIYCAMTEVLDRMKHDDVIDVFQCVKRLREHRPGLVENVDQYTLCYDLVGTYLQRFATYSN